MNKSMCAAFGLLLAFLAPAQHSIAQQTRLPVPADLVPEVVATVNGKPITREHLAGIAIAMEPRGALQTLIEYELVRQEAEKEGVAYTDEELQTFLAQMVESELANVAHRLGATNPEEYPEALERIGTTMEGFRKEFRDKLRPHAPFRLLTRKLVVRAVDITEGALREEFERQYGPKVKLRQIVLKTRREAEEVLRRLKLGAEFAETARRVSIDRVSAAQGGQVPPQPVKSLLGQAVANLEPGRISDVVETLHGCHILKLEARIPSEEKDFEEVKEPLRADLLERRIVEKTGPWFRELANRSEIETNL